LCIISYSASGVTYEKNRDRMSLMAMTGTTDGGGPVTPEIKRGFGETPKPASLLVAGTGFEPVTFGL